MKDTIVGKTWGWISGRLREPSSWAAAAAVLIGLGTLLSLHWAQWVLIVAVVIGVGGILLREQK
ncbi:MAG: hypothetical protein QGI09_03185 [Dehalococcoidia bacterium]|jgi:hypothetical protein|nr:hypothetical protein [Dehalococcoidia bacterium]|tara:strand:+ start:1017 stop:1208 length:192 start_codon:yes stop_codon:yes gene_type:complete